MKFSWLLLSLLLLSTPALAGKPAPAKSDEAQAAELKARFDQAFNGIDSNGDGKISRDEASQKAPSLAANFDTVDSNKDGFLSKAEIWEAQAKMNEAVHEANQRFSQALQKADKNKDGKLSREEAQSLPRMAKHFDQIDVNKDGFLVIQEIIGFMQSQLQAQIRNQLNQQASRQATPAASAPADKK